MSYVIDRRSCLKIDSGNILMTMSISLMFNCHELKMGF